jgi:hypothetical protein
MILGLITVPCTLTFIGVCRFHSLFSVINQAYHERYSGIGVGKVNHHAIPIHQVTVLVIFENIVSFSASSLKVNFISCFFKSLSICGASYTFACTDLRTHKSSSRSRL